VIAILNRCPTDWELVWSFALTYEIAKILDPHKKHYIASFARKTTTTILVDKDIKIRADTFMKWGVKALDALHIACAEQAEASVFLTTDDALKNIMCSHSDRISIKVTNPAAWYEEVTGDESEDTA
jgi:predicted nucleic acid-binding protein